MYIFFGYSYGNSGLPFLCEMLKSYDLGAGRGHVIIISKLPKIAKMYCVRPAVPHYSYYTRILIKVFMNVYKYFEYYANNYARGKLAISGKAAAPSRPLPLWRHSATRSGGDDAQRASRSPIMKVGKSRF
jgi:hypothetical protein